jgi:hypothetical protein
MRDRGVVYRYAWWCDPQWGRTFWVVAGALLLGLGWQGFMSLVGRTGLVAAEAAAPTGSVARPEPSPSPMPTGASLEAAMLSLESSIGDGGTPATLEPQGVGAASTEPPQCALAGGPLEPVTGAPAVDAKTYGAKADDYYPTERRKHGTSAS